MFEGIYEFYICNNAGVDSSNLNLFANIDVYIIFLIQPFDPMAHLSYFFADDPSDKTNKIVTQLIRMRTNGKKYKITVKSFKSGLKKFVCETW